jgi:hypothetical protein
MLRVLQKLLRTTFPVEPLEQRILLLADPLGVTARALALRDVEPAPAAVSPFAVGGSAFDAALSETRAAFMDSPLALTDPGYGVFIDGVLSAQVLDGELRLQQGLIDNARLAVELGGEVGGEQVRALVVGSGASLAGSGAIAALAEVEGTLAPSYSSSLPDRAAERADLAHSPRG